ncbi:selenocysteine-specific translation elongation factor [Pedococcus sp. 5OH_020]|uniref:selenocysteine-specific translation elongation factor n=1 Tax=Pedococcus sp. 5OH_020 TaxID=2989814 RepID=UPI0022EA081F|nr:selenocysteine-specific translation elongation factor [Pedococcus sp. 5OH_020]
MHVVATAGHVDHGKSALVRALTGIEPDRWDEEHRRGLTIDLGYAWTTLPAGEQLAFVDVPGHERFIGNMLAGLGPVPAVLFVVAADEGWRRQSSEHLAAVDALGIRHGLLVVTRTDLADPAATLSRAAGRLAASSLRGVPAVAVSARTGEGLDDLRTALSGLVSSLPRPRAQGRVRLWVDRAFSIKGSGTVVTGTLGEGTIALGDRLELSGREIAVRGLQSLGQPVREAEPVCRVAVNLRGLSATDVARGDALLTPDAWRPTGVVDVRLVTAYFGDPAGRHRAGDPVQALRADPGEARALDLPAEGVLHVGTAAVGVRIRPLGAEVARLTLGRALPLVAGDRAILRDPGSRALLGGLVLDADPPVLQRRGAGARRAEELAGATGIPDLVTEVGRRGAMRVRDAEALGILFAPTATDAATVRRVGDWLVAEQALAQYASALAAAVSQQARTAPLEPSLSVEAARAAAGVPDRALVTAVAARAGLEVRDGRVWQPGVAADLGAAEEGLRRIEQRLAAAPFQAPERPELQAAGLGNRELAAAERTKRILRLDDDVVLLPDAPARAMRELSRLDQPFTLSEARQALATTRRVAVPLLEYLDRRGWTSRVDSNRRQVRR